MRVAISQPLFLGALVWWQKIINVDKFVLLDDVQFCRRDFQHRNKITDKIKTYWVTVPVKKVSGGQLIKDVEINYDHNWRETITGRIEHCYRKCEHFDDVYMHLAPILTYGHKYLKDLSSHLTQRIADMLGVKTQFFLSHRLNAQNTGKTQYLVDICKELGATGYYSGSQGWNYLEKEKFDKEGMNVILQKVPEFEYMKLSIIDLLMRKGIEGTKEVLNGLREV